MTRVRSSAAGVGLALAVWLSHPSVAEARPTRPRFEPTDLDLEDPGTLELDLQAGPMRGQGDAGNRFILPDFEIDLGLTSNVEIDIDGAFSVDQFDTPRRHYAGEALWTAVKLGFVDTRGAGNGPDVALGCQIGPRLPTIGARGVGYGALALLGVHRKALTVVLNAGGIIDPGTAITSGQSKSIVAGLDTSYDLDARGTWSGLLEFAVAKYLSPEPNEIGIGAGAIWSVNPNLDLSLVALGGLLPGADRLGLLLGVTPTGDLW